MVIKELGTVKDMARLLNCSPRNIQILASKGILGKVGRGEYPLLESLHRYLKFLRYQTAFYAGRARQLDRFKPGFSPFDDLDLKKLEYDFKKLLNGGKNKCQP